MINNYKLINDLTAGKFFSGGKIFVKLDPVEPEKRKAIFEKIKNNTSTNIKTKLNFDNLTISEDQFKSKMINSFLDLSKTQNPAAIDNIKIDANNFINQLLPDDIIIFLPSTGINSNELHENESNCIIYFEIGENFNLGFVIDKVFFDILSKRK